MCILATFSKSRPTLEMLQKFQTCNSDGGGVAWFGKDGKAHYKKNLNAVEKFKITEVIPFPFIVHDRLSSYLGKLPLLTHPFVMSKDSPLALEGSAERLIAHNGHINSQDIDLYLSAANIAFPDDKSPISDTRAIAAIASQNEKFLTKIKGCYAVMDGRVRKIRLYGDFKKKDGNLFSNLTWEYTRNYSGHYHSSSSYGANVHVQQSKYDFDENEWAQSAAETTKKDRKQKRKEWWEAHLKQLALKENVKPVIDLTENAGTFQLEEKDKPPVLSSIHSQPPAPHFADSTKKILGIPVSTKIHQEMATSRDFPI